MGLAHLAQWAQLAQFTQWAQLAQFTQFDPLPQFKTGTLWHLFFQAIFSRIEQYILYIIIMIHSIKHNI